MTSMFTMSQLLPLLAAGSSAQREVWRWSQPLPNWLAAVVILGALAFAAFVYLMEPKLERGSLLKPLLSGLRAAIIIGCFIVLLDPIESKETVEVRDAYTVVLVDKSTSMTFKDRFQKGEMTAALTELTGLSYESLLSESRLEQVKRILAKQSGGKSSKGIIRDLRAKNKVRIYAFDSNRFVVSELDKLDKAAATDEKIKAEENLKESTTIGLIKKLKADGVSTSLGDSLSKVQKDLRAEKVTAVIVLTDGRQNSGSLDPIEQATRFGRRKIPIYTIGVGDPREPKDLVIDNLQAPDVSIVGDIVSFDFVAKAQGYSEAIDATIELRFNDELKESRNIALGGSVTEKQIRIQTKPLQPGEYNVQVRIVPHVTEQTTENNTATHLLRVIDQKIKVLYIDGYPRWEYRYLKNALIRDRTKEVQCLLLSAEPKFPQEATPGVPRLTRIPDRKELMEYHVIILGDVNPQARWPTTNEPVFRASFWDEMTEFVGDFGGGLLIIGGERHCPKNLRNTKLNKALPMVLDSRSTSAGAYTQIFYPKLTRLGLKSPLMRLDPDRKRNSRLWATDGSGLPGFYWYERIVKAKPLARVLAVHPTESNENGDYPLFLWQYYKSGAVFCSLVDSTWRWRAGVGDTFTYRFYRQIIRFLSTGRFQRSKRFYITTDKTEYNIGDEVQVSAKVLDRDLKPSTLKEQLAELDLPDGTREKLTLRAVDKKPGFYETTYRVTTRGDYRASLIVGDAGSEENITPRKFIVTLPSAELSETKMAEKVLKSMAKVSGGQYYPLASIDKVVDAIPDGSESIPLDASQEKLWDNQWTLIILFSLLTLEWLGRKSIRLQ